MNPFPMRANIAIMPDTYLVYAHTGVGGTRTGDNVKIIAAIPNYGEPGELEEAERAANRWDIERNR